MISPSADHREAPSLSVVVMGYRNAETIEAAVGSVLSQESGDPFEVVVVTSGGDDSASRLRRAGVRVEVVDHRERLLPGAARNAGVVASRGSRVAFLAADCEAAPGWVAGRQRAHAAGHRAVAGAMGAAGPLRPSALASMYLLFAARLSGRPPQLVSWPDPAAHGLSFDRDLLDELGPFDPRVRAGEDTAVARSLAEREIGVWFEPSVRTLHHGPPTLPALIRDEYRRGARRVRSGGRGASAKTSWPGTVGFEVRLLIRSLRFIARTSWENAGAQKPALLVAAPWMLAGAAARTLGAARERGRLRA